MKIDLKQINRFITEISKRYVLESKEIEELSLNGEAITGDTYFGAFNTVYDVYGSVNVPSDWDNFILEVHTDREGYDSAVNPQFKLIIEGELVGTYDINHRWVRFDKNPGRLDFNLNIYTGNNDKKFPVKARIFQYSREVLSYLYDLEVLKESLDNLSRNDIQFYKIYNAIIDSMKQIDVDSEDEIFIASIIEAKAIIDATYDSDESYKPVIHAVGHTHIDIAWLWTVSQAVEKAERSFTTILNYMDDYPEFKFIQSQPQLYDLVEKKNPQLFKKIEKAIKNEQWEPEGSMWVESDTTLVSGESLVRQLLYGKQYFKEKFDVDNKILWLPDVFGYSAALPQLLAQAGVPYFMTTKLSWNQFNKIPYDTFEWVGIDGSKVLTHFIPTPGTDYKPRPWYTTYNGFLDVPSVVGGWERYQQKNINNEVLNAFGFGDGGGGPTEKMLETGQRLAKGIPGIPSVKFSKALEFFEKLDKDIEGKDIPSWHGELYFEFHRGTYTARAENKLKNRKLEFALQNIEKLHALTGKKEDPIHKDLWKKLLLNQFHDILPGSSIKEVYDDSNADYKWIESELARINNNILSVGKRNYLFNPIGIAHNALVRGEFTIAPLNALVQKNAFNETVISIDVDQTMLTEIEMSEINVEGYIVRDASDTLETPFYTVKFNEWYEITSLFDKENNKEVVLEGRSINALRMYEDLPSEYDAWDVDIYHTYKSWDVNQVISAKIISDGPIETVIEIVREFSKSKIIQKMHFYKSNRRIDFNTEIAWYENGKLLKAEFDVDVNAKEATFDIQYGTINRDNHSNTSWEVAQFEVNAQKWADLSDRGYGFSLLNDSKYGYGTKPNHMSLSLLRSSNDPFEHADHGTHHFTYSILPHSGDWYSADVMDESYILNNPVQAFLNVDDLPQVFDVKCDSESVYVDTIKQSEAKDAHIVRLFEYANIAQEIRVEFTGEVKSVFASNILEEELEQIELDDKTVIIKVKPYEVVTLKVKV